MGRRPLLVQQALVAFLLAAFSVMASAEPLNGVRFADVTLSDAFWAPRIETNRVATIPHLLSELEKQGSLGGFRILAGDRSAPYRGYMWGDSDVYKTIEGIAASLSLRPDPALAERTDRIIDSITAAQDWDGYIFPHLQIQEPQYRHFADETTRTCESYSIGHLIESAVQHQFLTGRTNYLTVARKAAELLRRTHAEGELLRVSGHPEIELALIRLYEATGEAAWLELAASLIENARRIQSTWSQGRPPLSGDDAHGHAVATLYLYSAATDLARFKGNTALTEMLHGRWNNIIGRKLYLTGGLGHSRHSEGFAPDYDLPNDVAYCETCAAIANVFWQQRLFLASGNAAYIDVLERSLYNNVLAGIALSGDRFFYVNPLATDGKRKFNQGLAERFSWTGCPCCPVNLVRLLPRVGGYFYATDGNAVFVNLFAANKARIRMPSGDLVLRQHTQYPWDGRVQFEIVSGPPQPVALHVRIPGWARGQPVPTDLYQYIDPGADAVKLTLNAKEVPLSTEKGYAVLRRTWLAGDHLELTLPMPVRRVLAHEKVKENAGHTAVERGPIVYCVEGVDHGGQVLDLALPDDAKLTASVHKELLGGLVVIEGTGQRVAANSSRSAEPVRVRFIPYYAWNHRGVGPMAVWIPRTPGDVNR